MTQRHWISRGNSSMSLRKLVAGFILTRGFCISQTNQTPQCNANDRVHMENHILNMFTQRKHKARKCLHTVTKVSAREVLRWPPKQMFTSVKQNKAKQNKT